MGREDRTTWKANYFTKLIELLDTYQKVFLVTVDNVSSKQMQQIRIKLRGRATLLMGKNTTIRKAIRGHLEQNPQLEKLLPCIKGNVGFVFTNGDLGEIRDLIGENRVQAPAKAGAIAPINVHVVAGNTGLGPEKTSFFQALHIATKITRGTIEILNNVHLIHIGEKVGASEATLLSMLKIYPFSYGLEISQVYEDGAVFSPNVLDIKTEYLLERFMEGIGRVAALSLQIGYPTVASVPHSIVNGFKRLLAVAVATDITFPEAEQAKAFVADPSAFVPVVTQTEAAADAGGGGGEGEEAKEEKKEEEEEESDDDMGFGLFD